MIGLPWSPWTTAGLQWMIWLRPGYLRISATGVLAGDGGPADVLLQHDVLGSPFGKEFPVGLVAFLAEFMRVVVVAALHADLLEFLGRLVEEFRQFPAAVRLGEPPVARHDQVLAAEDLVELHRLGQFVTHQLAGPDVRAADFQAQVVEPGAEPLGVAAELVVAGELDGVESHVGHLGQDLVEILPAIVADRIQLERQARLLSSFGGGPPSGPARPTKDAPVAVTLSQSRRETV